MTISTQWQLEHDAAERYERILVPAILGPAAQALVEFAAMQEGEAVLDVGCGTGAAARYAAERVGPAGRVVGVDVNAGMIDLAQSLPPVEGAPIEWFTQSAYDLPFPKAAFDIALCAQTLQFLDDRPRALAEIYRVLKPGGRVAISLWCDIRESPYFDALVQAIRRNIGSETAMGLQAAFGLSSLDTIHTLLVGAGFEDLQAVMEELDLALPKLMEFVPRHVSATPMAVGFDAAPHEAQHAVIQDVSKKLARYQTKDGVRIPFRTYLLKATKA